jgi:hypothetical protein
MELIISSIEIFLAIFQPMAFVVLEITLAIAVAIGILITHQTKKARMTNS